MWKSKLLGDLRVGCPGNKVFSIWLLPYPLGCSFHLLVKVGSSKPYPFPEDKEGAQCLFKGMAWKLHMCLPLSSHSVMWPLLADRRWDNVVSDWVATCPIKGEVDTGGQFLGPSANRETGGSPVKKTGQCVEPRQTVCSYTFSLYKPCESIFSFY